MLVDNGDVDGFRVPPEHTPAVRSLKFTAPKQRREPSGAPILERDVELRVADPVAALALLAKHYTNW